MKHYSYMFVRADLSHSQQIIQTAHAVEAMALQCTHKVVCHAVLFELPDATYLELAAMRLDEEGIRYEMFYEPDIGEYTAIATYPISGESRKHFKRYKLKK